jgi:hypothetical protein
MTFWDMLLGVLVKSKDNPDPSTYGGNDISSPLVSFASVCRVDKLTENGAKEANFPYITALPILQPFLTTLFH